MADANPGYVEWLKNAYESVKRVHDLSRNCDKLEDPSSQPYVFDLNFLEILMI